MKNIKNVTEKKTLNLAIYEHKYRYLLFLIPFLLILGVAIAYGWKTTTDLRYQRLNADRVGIEELERNVAALKADMTDYDAVAELYAHRSTAFMTDNEKALRDRMEIIDLLTAEFAPHAGIRNFTISGNTVSVNLSDISLEGISVVVQNLYALDAVNTVSVHSATGKDEGDTSVSMLVTFKPKEVTDK